MSISKVLGIILFVVGIVLLVVGWNSSQGFVDQVAEATTGRFTKSTLMYIIAGLAMVIGGAALWMGGRPKP